MLSRAYYFTDIYNSPEPKTQVNISDQDLSVVRRCFHFSHWCCCKLSHFYLLLQNHWVNFNQTWHKAPLGEGDSSLFKWRALPFSKGRWLGNNKNTLTKFKKIFSRTTIPISSKLGTKHPWVKVIKVCSIDQPSLFPSGDSWNRKNT